MTRWLIAGLFTMAACSSTPGGSAALDARAPSDANLDTGLDGGARSRFQTCRGRPFTAAPVEAWRHGIATPITTAAGAANHSAQDPITPPATATSVHGKFAYGAVSKDLQDEKVAVWIDDCTSWRSLGQPLTDSDGRIAAPVPSTILAQPGVYEVRLQVLGDASQTRAYVWALPRGTHLALTDVDGTMTSSDAQLFQQILDGSHVPVAYPGATSLTTAHAGRGQVLLYLTGRPYYLTQRTRDWLTNLGFAAGPVHVTDSNGEAVPTQGGVGDFKKRYLADLLAAGYLIDVGYGNATTDVYAYLGAGLPADRVWIIGTNGGAQGTHAVTDSWVARAAEVQAGPPVLQPFDW
jgi:LNS2 (Lipin/Ned1/Smp2)